jgi:hypothetical protein
MVSGFGSGSGRGQSQSRRQKAASHAAFALMLLESLISSSIPTPPAMGFAE